MDEKVTDIQLMKIAKALGSNYKLVKHSYETSDMLRRFYLDIMKIYNIN